ncbi:MAG: hypothetical protein JXQ91_03210 [Vannielia sp.]|uniref:hypothetical protein n=1 Tax=Vannielia sp. TaxID=2813045 RepID=UPI003B8D1703
MRRLPLVLGLALGAATLALLALGGWTVLSLASALRGVVPNERSLADLPRVPLSQVLSTDLAEADLLVFHDGPRGWYAIEDPAPLNDTEIGFYGRRFLGELTNTGPAPQYCEGDRDAKIIWAVRDAREVAAMAYCNVSRMDFAPLLPHARPVTLTDARLTEAEIAALRPQIAADPARHFVDVPAQPLPFTHHRALRPPMLWGSLDRADEGALETALTKAISAAMQGAPHFTHIYNDRLNYAAFHQGDSTQMTYGSYILTEQGPAVLEVLYLYAPYIEVSCAPQDCARLDGLSLAPAIVKYRPAAPLNTALANPVPFTKPHDSAANPRDPLQRPGSFFIPRPEHLHDTATNLAPTTAYTTRTRHIAPRQD